MLLGCDVSALAPVVVVLQPVQKPYKQYDKLAHQPIFSKMLFTISTKLGNSFETRKIEALMSTFHEVF